jgi:GTP-binding protein
MFIDEITIQAIAGRGGDGVVRWRREKFIDKGGPNGGDGGRGGHIYAIAKRGLQTLSYYSAKNHFKAERGEDGMGGSKHGSDGKSITLEFPIGTIITNKASGEKFLLEKEGQKFTLLAGGTGGKGNEHFKSSLNVAPKKATPGKPGAEATFFITLELFADVGLIGLPNAGKSSLLNSLTHARAKIGDYPFTTLDPNLGDLYGYTIADIPGLIEGASEGKGLGIQFLRHIKKTRVLVHLVSFENGLDMMKVYKKIRKELEEYGEGLKDKEEIILLTKTDVTDEKTVATKLKEFKKLKKPVYALTLYDEKSVKEISDILVNVLKKGK